MHFPEILLKKRNGGRLSAAEIDYFVSGYVKGTIPDYQMSALLMAIWFVGLNDTETAELTFAMRDSGETIDLSGITGMKVDKHSTGGVADTTTLITAPIAAACGLKVAKMSGRGLGHTGGTIDKLESIPGFRTDISMHRFREIVDHSGMSIIGQTRELVPADKLLYALRGTTGTVDNISLISSSIMSKKLASGSETIVLDVKTGNGAFMKSVKDAERLARVMVAIGQKAGKKIAALVTDMNQPLGNAVGNALEVREAIEILQGNHEGDLQKVSIALSAQLLYLSGLAQDETAATKAAIEALESGRALEQLAAMIKAQRGEPDVCINPDLLPTADRLEPIVSECSGYVTDIATDEIGLAALLLGAGRVKKTDIIDPAVGIWLMKRVGDYVEKGEELAFFHVNSTDRLEEARLRFIKAFRLGKLQPTQHPMIYTTIS
ncbi:thymidine phosphorylase [Desulfopila sp. IMCC35008]|uniref:thymidine phosphorylase n=1 Tax=Desulfopila sp. IMCC35008 TaxID=2653858 RepID=UPI0013CFE0C9|nr:thymidine phosphorylase [Desulfopila sp. IMCC35008]